MAAIIPTATTPPSSSAAAGVAGHGDLGAAARAVHPAVGMADPPVDPADQVAGTADPPADPAAQRAGMAARPADPVDQALEVPVAAATAAHREDRRRVAVAQAAAAAINARRGPGGMHRHSYLLFNPAMPKPRLPCWVRGIAPG